MNTHTQIKVCHFTSAHRPDDVRIFLKECSSLAAAGFDVYLVAANCDSGVKHGVNIVGAKAPVSGRFARMLNASRIVYKKALSLDADIYHFHDPELLPYGLKLKRKGRKVIYDAHEDVPKQILGKYWISKRLRTIVAVVFRMYENYVSKRLDYILTATPFIRDRFIKVNPNCEDINNFPLLSELVAETSWAEKQNEVCYIGGISAIRGVEALMDGMEKTEGLKLNLAGDFSPESFRDTIAAKPAWDKVNEYGFVGRSETAKIMSRSKVGIVTFLPLPNHLDAQPNKMFEYMSAAIPVLASDFPLWREILVKNDCGICIDPEDPKAIADALKLFITDDKRAEQMGRNGRNAVIEKYNWTAEERKLISVYESLSGRRTKSTDAKHGIPAATKKIKVCHFTSAHQPDDVRIFHKECNSLAAAGFDVYLVAANCASETKNGVKIIGAVSPASGRFTRMMKTARIVYQKALSLNADIYHFHDPELLPYALKLKRKGKKVIYDAHEDVPKQILGKYWINELLRKRISWAFEKYENFVAARLDYIVAATPFIRDRFKKINKNTGDVCNYPIIAELSTSAGWENKKNEVCYVGGITKIRGIVEVVNALQTADIRLNLAGGYSPKELKAELSALAGWKNVKEYGFVGREKIAEILERSKAGIVTLYPQINYLDSLPIKMFEYMLAGIPVIASDFPLWRQIIEENQCGICVDPLDSQAIAKGIQQIMNDDAAAKKMGEKGKAAVLEKFNWGAEEKKLIAIYHQLS